MLLRFFPIPLPFFSFSFFIFSNSFYFRICFAFCVASVIAEFFFLLFFPYIEQAEVIVVTIPVAIVLESTLSLSILAE